MTALLLGIFVAAIIFGSLLWCAYQAYMNGGLSRVLHLGAVLFTIAVMATITYQTPPPGKISGLILAAFSLGSVAYNSGWARLLPLTLAALGIFCAIGGPFG